MNEKIEPEWEIFKRLETAEKAYEQLQERTNELQKEIVDVKPTLESHLELIKDIIGALTDIVAELRDANILAREAYLLCFLVAVRVRPDNARTLKDTLLTSLQNRKLSAEKLKDLRDVLVGVCDKIEER